jgi:hypothetical protein
VRLPPIPIQIGFATGTGPPFEPGRILDIVRRRVQFIGDHNGCPHPEQHVSRKMLTVSFIKSRMVAAAEEVVRGFVGYITNEPAPAHARCRAKTRS